MGSTNHNAVLPHLVDDSPEGRIGQALHDLLTTLNRRRAHLTTAADGTAAANWSTRSIIFGIASSTSPRITTLAEGLAADPSTVSRQVATLVKCGLVERLADPDDGRSSQLALTEAGRERLQAHLLERHDWLDQMLAGWTDDEIATFATLFDRFRTALEQYRSHPPSPAATSATAAAEPASAATTSVSGGNA